MEDKLGELLATHDRARTPPRVGGSLEHSGGIYGGRRSSTPPRAEAKVSGDYDLKAASFFMADLRRGGLPGKGIRELTSAVTPLTKGHQEPPRQDLTSFWSLVHRVLPGLCPDFSWEELGSTEIGALGPYLLGEAGW